MSVGIMPLFNDDWGRGKCSYKMLQYMACGIPVVVSPVGMNAEVLGQGEVGFGANSAREWHEGLMQILDSRGLRRALGENGRRLAKSLYSIPVISGQIAACLRKVHGRG
jgi:glycosyltransferase involved in cell wall biosynthesis